MTARRNTGTAVLFLAGIFGAVIFLFFGALSQSGGFLEAARPSRSDHQLFAPPHKTVRVGQPVKNPGLISLPKVSMEKVDALIQGSEPALNAALDRDYSFINLYGASQKLLGRQVVEDVEPKYTVVRLADGSLTFANPDAQQVDMTVRAQEMVEFAQRLEEEYETPLLYIQAPSKLAMASLPDGINDYADAEADQFLSILEEHEVDTLDLRPAFRQAAAEGRALDELFFRTDHHWTAAGAFLGFQTLADKLRDDYDYTIYPEITDPGHYNKYTFHDIFLGSQGKRVGTAYAGLDDLEVWSPNFESDFTYTVPMSGIERRGPFAMSLLFPEMLATDESLYESNPYTVYSGGDFLLARTVNEVSPYPWGRRVLVLRDSYGCAFTPFLGIISGEVITIDPRLFNGDQEEMLSYVEWLEPDLIFVLNTTSSLRVDELFPYLPTARADALETKRLEREQGTSHVW